MSPMSEVFMVVIALLIVASVCLGLLIALAIFILSRPGSCPSPTTRPPASDTSPPADRSKRIANCTVAISAGLVAIVFAANLVPIGQDWVTAGILLAVGLVVIGLAWYQFQRI